MKLLSWNVNGFRSVVKKDFWNWYRKEDADIVCLQETKIDQEAFAQELGLFHEHDVVLCDSKKRGYCGVATFSKEKTLKVERGLGDDQYDGEGRALFSHYKDFTLVNLYIPNGQRDLNRVPYKLAFSDLLLEKLEKLRKKQPHIILCGDFNVAHEEIDIRNPKSNRNNSGFTLPEREWMTKFLSHGYVDVFRHKNPDAKHHYTWWSYRPGVREKNIGWRIDYFIVSKETLRFVRDTFIQPDVLGSDHCPVGLVVEF